MIYNKQHAAIVDEHDARDRDRDNGQCSTPTTPTCIACNRPSSAHNVRGRHVAFHFVEFRESARGLRSSTCLFRRKLDYGRVMDEGRARRRTRRIESYTSQMSSWSRADRSTGSGRRLESRTMRLFDLVSPASSTSNLRT